ncbi:MAG: NAD-dependent epimerase/dehydratase family protein [Pseudomonadota bacterium]
MKIVITGAAGFLGRHLAERLLRRGESVTGFDLIRPEPEIRGLEIVTGSVEDPEALSKAMRGAEAVIHAAAITGLWARDPRRFHQVNAEGTRTVLDAAAAAGVTRVVHVSSFVTLIAASPGLGRGDVETVSERLELPVEAMLGPYPASKRAAELICRAHPLDPVIVQPSAPIGPGDHGPTPPGRLLRDLAVGKLPALIDCTWNFVHIHALADGIIAALEDGVPGRRYLMAGETLDTAEFAKLCDDLGLQPPRARVPYGLALASGLVEEALGRVFGRPPAGPLTGVRLAGPRRSFDSSRARRELGFRPPETSQALRDTMLWLRAQGLLGR